MDANRIDDVPGAALVLSEEGFPVAVNTAGLRWLARDPPFHVVAGRFLPRRRADAAAFAATLAQIAGGETAPGRPGTFSVLNGRGGIATTLFMRPCEAVPTRSLILISVIEWDGTENVAHHQTQDLHGTPRIADCAPLRDRTSNL